MLAPGQPGRGLVFNFERHVKGKGKGITMARHVEVVPAYGRDYNTKAEAVGDWHGGKDFRLASPYAVQEFGGMYVNEVDVARWNSEHTDKIMIVIRYRKQQRIVAINGPKSR